MMTQEFLTKMPLAPLAAAGCGVYLVFLAPFSGLRKTWRSMSITLHYAPYDPTRQPAVFHVSFFGRLKTSVLSSCILGAYAPLRLKSCESLPKKDTEITSG
ncbi:MAG: hypothetical protein ACI4CT_09345 [Lachnospiraceae bacterium]